MSEPTLNELEMASASKYREDLESIETMLAALSSGLEQLHVASAVYDTPYRGMYQRMVSTVYSWQGEANTLIGTLPLSPE